MDSPSLGRFLAHNEKEVRDQTVDNLKTWLRAKTDVEELDYLKLWKGLYVCMWMTDKTPIQVELGERLASLVRVLDGKRFDLFLKTFFQTIVREWGLIDRYRLDKYMFLIRFMLREALTQLKQWKWPKLRTATLGSTLKETVLLQKPDGVRLHIMDLIIPVLHDVAPEVSTEPFLMLLLPFFEFITCTRGGEKPVFRSLCKNVLVPTLQGACPEPKEDEPHFPNLDGSKVLDILMNLAGEEQTLPGRRKEVYAMIRAFTPLIGTSSNGNSSPIHVNGTDAAAETSSSSSTPVPKAATPTKSPKKQAKKSKTPPFAAKTAASATEAPTPKSSAKKKKRSAEAAAAEAEAAAAEAVARKRVRIELKENKAIDFHESIKRLKSAQVSSDGTPTKSSLKVSPGGTVTAAATPPTKGTPGSGGKKKRSAKKKGRAKASDFF